MGNELDYAGIGLFLVGEVRPLWRRHIKMSTLFVADSFFRRGEKKGDSENEKSQTTPQPTENGFPANDAQWSEWSLWEDWFFKGI